MDLFILTAKFGNVEHSSTLYQKSFWNASTNE